MQQVSFDPDGGALSVNIIYKSNHAENLFVTYTYTLWEAASGSIASEGSGNNFNSEDDRYWLPTPASKNKGRVVDVLSTLKNAGTEDLDARVEIEICQAGTTLETVSDTKTVGADSTLVHQLFIKLMA